ncbi:MAG: hypothetical protein NZ742_04155 [Acidobacteria bacterium]|nr:hypothetical protein [Acidobacteriota bacterium]MDW7984104.1 hypothetical protein [Acidobacteriota bacterium]
MSTRESPLKWNDRLIPDLRCNMLGLYVGFNIRNLGFVVVSPRPFTGAQEAGFWEGQLLRFTIPGAGTFEVLTKNRPNTRIPLWARLDPTFPKGDPSELACYASIFDPFLCEPELSGAECKKRHQEVESDTIPMLLRHHIQIQSDEVVPVLMMPDVRVLACCGACCGPCCGIGRGECWASDTTRKPKL